VGYAGGRKENPTYHSLGDHAETVEIDFDPRIISYEELLKVFWENHSPYSPPWSRQYMSAIFYHSEEQKRQATETLRKEQSSKGMTIYTEIVPAKKFYRAEDYHQKYYLRQREEVAGTLKGIFPSGDSFTDSTTAARLNAYFAGYLSFVDLKSQVSESGVSEEDKARILDSLRTSAR
jgi:peptide-methionine (S)-S-oxide reductase